MATTLQPAPPTVDPLIVGNFAAFRRPGSTADEVPAALRTGLGNRACWRIDVAQGGFQCIFGPNLTALMRQEHILSQAAPSLGGSVDAERLIRLISAVLGDRQFDETRKLLLPNGLGAVWLTPAGRWLCASSMAGDSPVPAGVSSIVRCEPAIDAVQQPPLELARQERGYLFGLEPNRVVSVRIEHHGMAARPGGG